MTPVCTPVCPACSHLLRNAGKNVRGRGSEAQNRPRALNTRDVGTDPWFFAACARLNGGPAQQKSHFRSNSNNLFVLPASKLLGASEFKKNKG